ncbi:MAG: proton-translocating NADH-quinone oxidoreductase, chain M [Candidatus Parvarchaeum acidiphilum ARMAN-4]|jgi:NADH-quinone oxidoreductase subunit M|uniref:Proton-translocating NADH-quinone oxidoreductase, chain M n=1 Tax=Candidatus Parvarchaeum acidiphilum ARMAN-4 TaxID=662760 RepID=D2EEH3_PARA4|nr:MAG: proton-translocating NADH-quinone oxidoreductase, chain M [Candidatus Parvarchaeum acidiphilum ARMAN-4]
MVNLTLLLIVPALGILLIILRRFYEKFVSPEIIVFSVMVLNAILFGLGLVFGFGNFSVNINSSISLAFSLQENFITIPFLFLATVVPLAILLFAVKEIKESKDIFYIFYLLVYLSVISVFISSNLLIFFVFWEVAVLSLFFITGLWGDKKKGKKAAMKFLVFTQFGSLTLLAVFILLFLYTGSFNFSVIASKMSLLPSYIEYIAFFLLLITVMIKMPIFPLHGWLLDSYYYSPSSGTMFLSSMLSKLGGFAFILFGFGLFRNVLIAFRLPLISLGVFTAVYIAFTASGQKDLKKLLSYSSMFYMALIFIGVSSGVNTAIAGSILLMVSHAFIITLLFGVSYILLKRTGTNEMESMGGIMSKMPILSFFLVFGIFASLGIPGLSNFPGELLIFIGSYSVAGISLIAIFGIMLSTNYYLRVIKQSLFGQLKKTFASLKDISRAEVITMGFLSFFILLIGLFPSLLLNTLGGL